jgi:DNA-directed RNA polymerase delta subunit
MTPAIAPKTALYDRDYLQWVEDVANKLRARDFDNLDIDNLIEEIEDLGKSEKKEILNRLTTLLEHLLKRLYVEMPQEFNGWERTIREQRRQIKRAVEFSPSLAPLFDQFFDVAFDDALDEVRKESGYNSVQFPDIWQFSRDIDAMLNIDFWA